MIEWRHSVLRYNPIDEGGSAWLRCVDTERTDGEKAGSQ